jgi:HEAT repeat protein
MKQRVRDLLQASDYAALRSLAVEDRRAVTALNRLLFDGDELTRWRAVRGLGEVAQEDPYLLDKVISRLFYTMNDDSGSIGWMAPQALGAILVGDPDLVEDYFSIVITSMENEVFRPGAVWAVGLVAEYRPDLVEEAGEQVLSRLNDPSPEVRGTAAWAMGRMRYTPARTGLTRLLNDQAELHFYEDDRVQSKNVAQLAQAALAKLDEGSGG